LLRKANAGHGRHSESTRDDKSLSEIVVRAEKICGGVESDFVSAVILDYHHSAGSLKPLGIRRISEPIGSNEPFGDQW